MNINNPNGMTAPISDDSKDSHLSHESMTDDSKGLSGFQSQPREESGREIPPIFLQGFEQIQLEESKLSILALACKSPVAVHQLLDSGFPTVLAQGMFEFCSKVMNHFSDANTDGMTDVSKTMNDKSQLSAAAAAEQQSQDGWQPTGEWLYCKVLYFREFKYLQFLI